MSGGSGAIRTSGEGGQVFILFSLMLVVLLLFVMAVVDVGFFLIERSKAQNVADAAALAGAQELPNDHLAAEAVARAYAVENGLPADSLEISFRCTSSYVQECNPAASSYDTIVVRAAGKAPSFFGGVLGMVTSDSCWTDGCVASARAAGCRGTCGATMGKVDVVTIIDHTASMSSTDLQNAKDGANELYRVFDYQAHRVALAVTPPVDPNNHCDSINNWSDSKVWLPVGLNANYQGAPHVLNNFSPLVSTTNCLDRPSSGELSGPHTNLGDPLKAAIQELQANGSSGARLGIVLFSDGAANVWDATAGAAIGARGPCDYAVKIAQQAKALGIEIYAIAYGADDRCVQDQSNSPWYNRPADALINAIATDDAHFYDEPRTADLDPIFAEIGLQLASGSKLVE